MSTTNRHNQYLSDTDLDIVEKEQLRNHHSFQGLFLGLSLALFFGGGATLFLFGRGDGVPTPTAESTLAPSVEPSSSTQPSTQETTIIREKTQELVPVPQATSVQPDININIPESQPSASQPSSSKVPNSQQTTQSPPVSSAASPEARTAPASQSQSPPAQ
jgi:hypothetical protein